MSRKTTTSRELGRSLGSISLFQLMVGATIAFAGLAAILRLSDFWTVTDVKYAEYAVVMFWGALLIVGALRHR